jgi:GrpB-like predicted nucleotidyltransferase (UPF0157 family)
VSRLTFVPSELLMQAAAAVFAEHQRRIGSRLPDVEIRHTGGTSIPGVLTSGDVDLQVRTDRVSFPAAREALSELYEPHVPQAWHREGAFFTSPGSRPPVELALTVIGTLDDLHHGDAWRLIAADPTLIERYNALKRAHEGGRVEAYQAAKRAFFYENFRL